MIDAHLQLRAELLAALSYDELTGLFRWKSRRASHVPAGSNAGCVHVNGYLVIHFGGRAYLAHRIAWLLVTGKWPANQIDHVNGNKLDNRIANLRDVTNKENGLNRLRANQNSGSGELGIHSTCRAGKPYAARIHGRHLGRFATLEEARLARVAAVEGASK